MIRVEVIADSKNQFGNRLTTMIVTFPRIILAEFNTHRMFSRNSASSRAIPYPKMIQSIKDNPFIPMAWQKNHSGMQGTEYLGERDVEVCRSAWIQGRDLAIRQADHIAERGATKQIVNRLLEQWMYHTAIVSATEFENFFALRCPQYSMGAGYPDFRSRKDYSKYVTDDGAMTDKSRTEIEWLQLNKGQAEIHMMALAEAMWDAYNESTPKELKAGQWHIPYEDKIVEMYHMTQDQLDRDRIPFAAKIGVVMAARTSYTVVGTEMSEWNSEKYAKKCDELATAKPLHASPFEHCARAMHAMELSESFLQPTLGVREEGVSGNFRGFYQYRKMLDNENITNEKKN